MQMKKSIYRVALRSFLAFSLTTTTFSSLMAAADAKEGEKVWKKINCALCHDKKGEGKAKGTPLKLNAMKGPPIAGLNEQYIVKQMTAIHDGSRKTAYTNTMKLKIKNLTPQDIENVSAYVATLSSTKIKGMLE